MKHIHYSIDTQPEICARYIAQAIRGTRSSDDIKAQLAEDLEEVIGKTAYDIGFELGQKIGQMWTKNSKTLAEEFFGWKPDEC